MRYRLFLITLLLLFIFNLNAQTIITGVVVDSLNNPIPSASVYLAKTTSGTLTDNKGVYSLTINQNGVYELIVSCIGYKPSSQIISAAGKKQKIDIKLSVNLFQLNEVTVNAKDKNRFNNYTEFIKLFLGETVNSQSCKIINPEVLHFNRNTRDNILNGFSVKPLLIKNRALGYTIIYDLSDFSFNQESGLLRFKGNYYYQPLKGTPRENKRWERNRLSAYYGSKMHFMRALFSDSLIHENFKIFDKYDFDTVKNDLALINPLQVNEISTHYGKDSYVLFHKNPLMIYYKDEHPELTVSITGFQPRVYISTILFTDTITVSRNGYYFDPYSVTWEGKMANERIADMLPFDFLPYEKVQHIPDSDSAASPIEKFLLSQQESVCRDQLFVHLDRNMYKPGDTIYFQVYIRDRFTNDFESKSVSLYALLFDDKQAKVDSSRFKIENATSSGWMAIPINAGSGKYHFVAFTGMMQNFDPVDAFQLDLNVSKMNRDPIKVEIGIDKKEYKPGDSLDAVIKITDIEGNPINKQKFQCSLATDNYLIKADETLTNTDGESFLRFMIPDTISFQPWLKVNVQQSVNKAPVTSVIYIPFENQFFELRFLPEGGTLVAGLEQRIGFNATTNKGEPVYIEGLLKNSSGTVLDTIRSGIYGPGSFVCNPQPGMYVEVSKGAGKEKIWQLPDPISKGICLSVKPVDNRSLAVEIQSSDYNGEKVLISGSMNMTQIFSEQLILNKKQRIIVETDQLPAGVAQITLFNSEMRPVAERLFYINADRHLKFDIVPGSAVYLPGQETELSVSVTDGQGYPSEGIFSIAVVDSVSGHDAEIFTPGIEYAFNYHPYFPGNLPPKVLIRGIENLTDEQRDLLLMVYGWSRYKWDFTQAETKSSELINYDLMKMKILYALKSHRADRRLDLISLEGPSIKHFFTDKNGEISLPFDSLPKITRSVTMMPDPRNKKRVRGAMLSIPYNQQFFRSNKLFISEPTIPVDQYNISPGYHNILLGEKLIELPEVTIVDHTGSKKEYHDKYEETYQYANIRSLDYELLWTASSLKDAVLRLVCPYMITDNSIILNPPRSFFGAAIPALIVQDGIPLYSDGWLWAKTLQPNEITSLTILKGSQGVALYGGQAAGGVIFINTRSDDPNLMKIRTEWKLQNQKDKMLLPINIYRSDIEYYNPAKSELESDPMLQSRSTIFWASQVYFHGKEPVKIKYPNLRYSGPVMITVNGASVNNLVGTGSAGYQVYGNYK